MARAKEILHGLAFTDEQIAADAGELSPDIWYFAQMGLVEAAYDRPQPCPQTLIVAGGRRYLGVGSPADLVDGKAGVSRPGAGHPMDEVLGVELGADEKVIDLLRHRPGLRLDTIASMIEGGDSGAVLTRGDVASSTMVQTAPGRAGMRILVDGPLPFGVTGKDLILYTIGRIGVDGALYRAMEFTGPVIDERARQAEFERELKIAASIQSSLLPHQLEAADGWRIAAVCRPAREVGGDFYDVLSTADGRLVIIEGDVTDKGVPAALVRVSEVRLPSRS